jgi:hypothetical protein
VPQLNKQVTMESNYDFKDQDVYFDGAKINGLGWLNGIENFAKVIQSNHSKIINSLSVTEK